MGVFTYLSNDVKFSSSGGFSQAPVILPLLRKFCEIAKSHY